MSISRTRRRRRQRHRAAKYAALRRRGRNPIDALLEVLFDPADFLAPSPLFDLLR